MKNQYIGIKVVAGNAHQRRIAIRRFKRENPSLIVEPAGLHRDSCFFVYIKG